MFKLNDIKAVIAQVPVKDTLQTSIEFIAKWKRTIIFVFAVLIVLVIAIPFLAIPAINKLDNTQAELATIKAKQDIYEDVIKNKETNEKISLDETAKLNEAAAKFGTPMKSEELDEYITRILVKCGMTTSQLQISDITPGVPKAFGESGTGSDSNSKQEKQKSTDKADQAKMSYYTIKVKATCSIGSLYSLIGATKAQPGLEIISYNWDGSGTTVASSATRPTINLEMKLYVI